MDPWDTLLITALKLELVLPVTNHSLSGPVHSVGFPSVTLSVCPVNTSSISLWKSYGRQCQKPFWSQSTQYPLLCPHLLSQSFHYRRWSVNWSSITFQWWCHKNYSWWASCSCGLQYYLLHHLPRLKVLWVCFTILPEDRNVIFFLPVLRHLSQSQWLFQDHQVVLRWQLFHVLCQDSVIFKQNRTKVYPLKSWKILRYLIL